MSQAIALPTPAATAANPLRSLRWALADALVVAGRHLTHLRSVPEKLAGMIVQPVIFVLLFGYVFGSAVTVPGVNYREFLMPGIFALTMAGTLVAAATGMAEDRQKGIIDRLRSLPIARSAAILGATLANLAEAIVGLVLLVICGLAVGWRTHTDPLRVAAGFGLLMLFQFAMNWAGIYLGMLARSADSADQIGMTIFMPLAFVGNTFVPMQGLPGWLQTVTNWNPVSAIVQATRQLFGNTGAMQATAWPMQHAAWVSLGWSLVILAIFAPLCVRRYRTMATK